MRDVLLKDLEHYRELYAKCIADANAIKGCMQYIESKLAVEASPKQTPLVEPDRVLAGEAEAPRKD